VCYFQTFPISRAVVRKSKKEGSPDHREGQEVYAKPDQKEGEEAKPDAGGRGSSSTFISSIERLLYPFEEITPTPISASAKGPALQLTWLLRWPHPALFLALLTPSSRSARPSNRGVLANDPKLIPLAS
jgi:hypothetical protein